MSVLTDLAAELDVPPDTLRASLLVSEGAEALQPNYLTIDPVTHQVGAHFTGLVNALGLILPAAAAVAGGDPNKIEWKRASDGGVVAYIEGYATGGQQGGILQAVTLDNLRTAVWFIQSQAKDGPLAGVTVASSSAAGGTLVSASAAGHAVSLINDANVSDFLRLASGSQLQLLGLGLLDGRAGSFGFQFQIGLSAPVRHGVGSYTVTCNAPAALSQPLAWGATWGASGVGPTYAQLTTGATTVNTSVFNPAGAAADDIVSIVVLG